MKKKHTTRIGGFLFFSVIAIIGVYREAQNAPKTTPTQTPSSASAAVVSSAKPTAPDHPAEARLNELGLTLGGGVGVGAGVAKTETEGGTK